MSERFTTPTQVSAELLSFLELPENTLLSRMDVSRNIMEYCKEKELIYYREIVPDVVLAQLLKLKDDNHVSILNLQKYLKHLYIKTPEPIPEPEPTPVLYTLNTPSKISKELQEFLELPEDSLISYNNALRKVLCYCKQLHYWDEQIRCDTPLIELFHLKEGNTISISELKTNLKQHFQPVTQTPVTQTPVTQRLMPPQPVNLSVSSKTKYSRLLTPVKVSKELLAFLKLPPNTLISRLDADRKLLEYCKANNLIDGTTILPNAPITQLLQLKEDEDVTISNIQFYLRPHFIQPSSNTHQTAISLEVAKIILYLIQLFCIIVVLVTHYF